MGKKENNTNVMKNSSLWKGKAFFGNFSKRECISSKRSSSVKPITFQCFWIENILISHILKSLYKRRAGYEFKCILLGVGLNSARTCTASVAEAAVAPLYLMRLKFMCDFVSILMMSHLGLIILRILYKI